VPDENRGKSFYLQSNTPWNSLLTRCFINEHKKSVLAPSHGCFVLDALEYMGVKPKQAGWDGEHCKQIFLMCKPCFYCGSFMLSLLPHADTDMPFWLYQSEPPYTEK